MMGDLLDRLRSWPTTELTRTEVFAAQAAWRSRFGRPSHVGYDWHVFSFDEYPSVSGEAARRKHQAIVREGALTVVSAWNRKVFGFTIGGSGLPDLEAGIDVLVFDESLTWTMAFTHCHGPYFAVADPRVVDE
ncbi:MAG: DUF4275 family protein [Archangiaceae bacterium]|nr:DUF4275 family protein [Archangiaceae bacterium]